MIIQVTQDTSALTIFKIWDSSQMLKCVLAHHIAPLESFGATGQIFLAKKLFKIKATNVVSKNRRYQCGLQSILNLIFMINF